ILTAARTPLHGAVRVGGKKIHKVWGGSTVSRYACAPFVRASAAAMAGVAALVGFSSQVAAAEADEDDEEILQEVQVTGTRIQSPNVTSSNPVTSITGEEMRRLGFVNVADALTQLVPQNISSYMPTLTGD